MIEALVDLINRDMDELLRQLADLLEERHRYEMQVQYWHEHLHGRNSAFGFAQGEQIAAWLQYGERAQRELKILEEKDFLVVERISDCRDLLLSLTRRKEALTEVLNRRRLAAERLAQRRQMRDMMQRNAAQRMLQEGEEPWA